MIFRRMIFFIGRICFSLIFLIMGTSTIINWEEKEQALVNSMLDLLSYSYKYDWVQTTFDFLMPWISQILIAITAIQILGALLVLFGVQMRVGAILLSVVLIITTLLFNHFWFLQGEIRDQQFNLFLRNLSIFGASLIFSSRK